MSWTGDISYGLPSRLKLGMNGPGGAPVQVLRMKLSA